MPNSSFKDRVKALGEQADEHLESMVASLGDVDLMYRELRSYLQCRFLLEDEDMDTDDLKELAERSIDRMLANHQNEDLEDLSAGCMGESSAMTKKILFVMTLRRKLGIEGGVERFGSASSVHELAGIIRESLR